MKISQKKAWPTRRPCNCNEADAAAAPLKPTMPQDALAKLSRWYSFVLRNVIALKKPQLPEFRDDKPASAL